ncbi:MAG: universal stress protein [Xanthobacteraceae bacterium]|nr:universal stress protein [Xanthobacteraceae bacterium]
MFKNILIPTDGSELSQKAAAKGVALAKALGAKVTAFFAAPPATPVVYRNNLPVGLAQPAEHEAIIKQTAAKHLDVIERAAKKAGVKCESIHATSDYPEDDILKIAAKKKCDLIVMGTHGQGGLRGIFVGSVTQKVLGKSKIPVMVVR